MGGLTILRLPYPVSANRYWQSHVPKGWKWKRAIVHRSKEADAYKKAVGWIAKQAGWREPTSKPIEIGRMVLIPPATVLRKQGDKTVRVKNGTRLNIDNCIKVTLDALNGIIYIDDAQIERIRGPIEYGPPKDPGGLEIEVYVMDVAQLDLIPDGMRTESTREAEKEPF